MLLLVLPCRKPPVEIDLVNTVDSWNLSGLGYLLAVCACGLKYVRLVDPLKYVRLVDLLKFATGCGLTKATDQSFLFPKDPEFATIDFAGELDCLRVGSTAFTPHIPTSTHHGRHHRQEVRHEPG